MTCLPARWSRWRKLSCARQALLVLEYLRWGDTYARLAAGFGVDVATVYRYVTELVDLLAAADPDLAAAVAAAAIAPVATGPRWRVWGLSH